MVLLLVTVNCLVQITSEGETIASKRDSNAYLFMNLLLRRLILLLALSGVSSQNLFFGGDGPPQLGPYIVLRRNYRIPALDPSDPSADVVFPISFVQGEKFPLLVFLHGLQSGGIKLLAQKIIMETVSSFGFIVIGTRSCDNDCKAYYEEALKIIIWSQENQDRDPILRLIDHSAGYGLYGSSMGGRGTAEALRYAKDYNVKAGVILHPGIPLETTKIDIKVPLAAFSGTEDECCGEETTFLYYNKAVRPKAFANMIGAGHYERLRWVPYVASWFKIFLLRDTGDYYNLIYGDESASLCGGSIPMTDTCEALQ